MPMVLSLNAVNVGMFSLLNFHASSSMCFFAWTISHAYSNLIVFDLWLSKYSLESYFYAPKAMREMHENMYCTKMSTFTVVP